MNSFESEITQLPIPFDNEQPDILPESTAKTYPDFAQLLSNTAGASPYLNSLMTSDPVWLEEIATQNPNDALSSLCLPFDTTSVSQVIKTLRLRKKKIALLTALTDLGGIWNLFEVTGALTRFADFSCQTLLRTLVHEAVLRNRLDLDIVQDPDNLGGIFVLAMGKMGGRELNYSSDIDLVVFFDEKKHSVKAFNFVKAEFVKITRKFAKLMGEASGDGYVFRTDLRLRPDPFVNPVCISVGGAERYYESFARTWERAAYIKARPCAGDFGSGFAFISAIEPFIWRMNLDFSAVQDSSEMRLRIWESRGTGDLQNLPGYNLKLGRGGIREIELFVQTFQMIAGGRDQSLRVPDTMGALKALNQKKWVDDESRRVLEESYYKLRTWEHRAQMIRDAQTHEIPKVENEILRMAALYGENNLDNFLKEIQLTLKAVHTTTESFFAKEGSDKEEYDTSFLEESDWKTIENWRRLPAFRTERATKIFTRLQPTIFNRLARSSQPREALFHLDGFLRGLPAGVQLFSLFEANHQLLELLVDSCAMAPRLANSLSRNTQVFDAVLEPDFIVPLENEEVLAKNLQSILSKSADYEGVLRSTRRWNNEHHFKIGVHLLKGFITSEQAGRSYARLANAVIRSLVPYVTEQFSRSYGDPPGRGFIFLAMGSLGAESLTSQSDLDLILIYDHQNEEYSKGKKTLASQVYYARLTQAMVSALSSQMAEGKLYDIDMRLRPSGRKGPVATSFNSFKHYQKENAWTWEHLALTRARFLAGCNDLGIEIEDFRRDLIFTRTDYSKIVVDVIDMRRRLAKNIPDEKKDSIWECRLGTGKLLDIELIAQAGALMTNCVDRDIATQLRATIEGQLMTSDECNELLSQYFLLRQIMQVARLTVEGNFSPDTTGKGVIEILLQQTDMDSLDELAVKVEKQTVTTTAIISDLIDNRWIKLAALSDK